MAPMAGPVEYGLDVRHLFLRRGRSLEEKGVCALETRGGHARGDQQGVFALEKGVFALNTGASSF